MSSHASPHEIYLSSVIYSFPFFTVYIRSRLQWHTWRMSHKMLQTDYSIIHYQTTSHMLCICLHDKYGNVSCININKPKCTKVWFLEMWQKKCKYVLVFEEWEASGWMTVGGKMKVRSHRCSEYYMCPYRLITPGVWPPPSTVEGDCDLSLNSHNRLNFKFKFNYTLHINIKLAQTITKAPQVGELFDTLSTVLGLRESSLAFRKA